MLFSKLANGLAGVVTNGLFEPGQGVAGVVPGWSPSALSRGFYQSRYVWVGAVVFPIVVSVWDTARHPRRVSALERRLTSSGSYTETCLGWAVPQVLTLWDIGSIFSNTCAEESGLLDVSESGGDVFFPSSGKAAGVQHRFGV